MSCSEKIKYTFKQYYVSVTTIYSFFRTRAMAEWFDGGSGGSKFETPAPSIDTLRAREKDRIGKDRISPVL